MAAPQAGDAASESSETGPDDSKAPINQIQLQEHLQRFAGVFTDRILQASEPLATSTTPKRVRIAAMRQVLLYSSAVLDIATGRFPEANLLDMLAFLGLCRGILQESWIPEVFGEAGRPLAEAFVHSERDLARIANNLLSREQLDDVLRLVEGWRKDNPRQRRVEQIRLFSFAETAGRLANEREREASGLLSSLTSATQSADQAVLLAERTMFIAQRMPFLLRWQAKIAAQEVTDEVLSALSQTDGPLRQANDLAAQSARALGDAHALVDVLQPLFQPRNGRKELRVERLLDQTSRVLDRSLELVRELDGVERALSSAERVTGRSEVLLKDMRGLLPAGEDPLGALLRGGLFYGAALTALFCGSYVVASRLTRDGGRGKTAAH